MKHPLLVKDSDIRKDRERIKVEYDLDNAEQAYAQGREPTIKTHKVLEEGRTWGADLISSKLRNGNHAPLLDLDVAHVYVPSTHEGHAHLYIEGVELPWWKYRILLKVLAWAGIIEKGYEHFSVQRGFSAARLPGQYKRGEYWEAGFERTRERAAVLRQEKAVRTLRDGVLF